MLLHSFVDEQTTSRGLDTPLTALRSVWCFSGGLRFVNICHVTTEKVRRSPSQQWLGAGATCPLSCWAFISYKLYRFTFLEVEVWDSFCLLPASFGRNVSKGAGRLTSCCTKKQVSVVVVVGSEPMTVTGSLMVVTQFYIHVIFLWLF